MGRKSLADIRRQEIVDAFYRCVVNKGLTNASIRKIAKEAGVQPSILHHYFKDRDEMIEQMVESFADTIFENFLEEMKTYPDPDTRFFKALEFMYSPGMINEEYSGFFLECCVEARRNPRVRATMATTFERFRETIITYMKEMNILRQLPEAQKENYATVLIAIHEGLELQWYIDPGAVSLEKATVLTREVINMLLENRNRPLATAIDDMKLASSDNR